MRPPFHAHGLACACPQPEPATQSRSFSSDGGQGVQSLGCTDTCWEQVTGIVQTCHAWKQSAGDWLGSRGNECPLPASFCNACRSRGTKPRVRNSSDIRRGSCIHGLIFSVMSSCTDHVHRTASSCDAGCGGCRSLSHSDHARRSSPRSSLTGPGLFRGVRG